MVVEAALRSDDPDFPVVRAREQRERLHDETHDAFVLGLERNALHERVRPIHAEAVIAVDVEAEDRVLDARMIAITQLERRWFSRLEHLLVLPARADHAGRDDLHFFGTPARTDLAARGALLLLPLAHLAVVLRDHVTRRALRLRGTLLEPERALAEPADRAEVV